MNLVLLARDLWQARVVGPGYVLELMIPARSQAQAEHCAANLSTGIAHRYLEMVWNAETHLADCAARLTAAAEQEARDGRRGPFIQEPAARARADELRRTADLLLRMAEVARTTTAHTGD